MYNHPQVSIIFHVLNSEKEEGENEIHTHSVFYLISAQTTAPKSSSIHQDSDFVSVRVGGDITLPCYYKGEIAAKLYWYKQPPGQKPQLVSTSYLYEKNATFYDDFKNNFRFTLDRENGKNYLTITDLHISDSATYYCMRCFLNMLEISETITIGDGFSLDPSVSN